MAMGGGARKLLALLTMLVVVWGALADARPLTSEILEERTSCGLEGDPCLTADEEQVCCYGYTCIIPILGDPYCTAIS